MKKGRIAIKIILPYEPPVRIQKPQGTPVEKPIPVDWPVPVKVPAEVGK